MPRGSVLKLLRKAAAFAAADLFAGEVAINSAGKNLAFSTDGSNIIKIPPFLSREFHSAGTIGILFPRAVTLDNVRTASISGGAPSFTYARSASYSGAQTAVTTWPQTFAAGEALHITVVSMADGTRCAVAWDIL